MQAQANDETVTPSADAGDVIPFLQYMVRAGASDLFLTAGAPPTVRIEGRMVPLGAAPLVGATVKRLAWSVMTEQQACNFERELECDLAFTLEPLGRFRFNIYQQRGEVSLVARHVRAEIPTVRQLRLPRMLEKLALMRQGLVLVVGAAGSGKSTTLASMLEHRNQHVPGHILTVEDPIEFLHRHNRCIVGQREVGLDTHSFSEALRRAMRESPDVIMIGEIRDEETMRHALHYAETGHLCLSTLHANNASQAIERIISFFPDHARRQVLMDLSLNLKAVVAQRLIPGSNGRRLPASELLLESALVADRIQKGMIDELRALIAKSNEVGMHSFDQSLYHLYERGEITLEQALEHADSRTDLSLRIRLSAGLEVEQPPASVAMLKKRRAA